MDFLSGLAKSGDSNKSSDEKSSSNLLASAKVVAEAAQAQFSNHPEKYDKGKAAAAAADLLDAGSDYCKLDDTKGVGKYVDQAENYLRHYSTPQSAAAGEEKPAPTAAKTSAPEAKKAEESEGGYGGLLKAAGGFFNK